MSIEGLRKQVNKANQYVSEKFSRVKKTEIEESFIKKEKKVDFLSKMIQELSAKTRDILQPNAAARMKVAASRGILKSSSSYPHPELFLAESLFRFAPLFGTGSPYGRSLDQTAEVFKEIVCAKNSLEEEVNDTFIKPLQRTANDEIKVINFHRKKMNNRRLDYDFKVRKKSQGSKFTEEDIEKAKMKFIESKDNAEKSMNLLLDNDAERISHLLNLLTALKTYHQRCESLISNLVISLHERKLVAQNESLVDYISHVVKPLSSKSLPVTRGLEGLKGRAASRKTSQPCRMGVVCEDCTEVLVEALYDFKAENSNELSFSQGVLIEGVTRVDSNWLQGKYQENVGLFPETYVRVLTGNLRRASSISL